MSYAKAQARIFAFMIRLFLVLAVTAQSSTLIAQNPSPTDILTPELRAWVEEHGGVFRVGTDSSYRPYVYSEGGQILGMAGDYFQLMSERLDISFVTVEYETFSNILSSIRNREIDVVPFLIDQESRREYLNFTPSIYSVQDRIFMRTDGFDYVDISSLNSRRVGYVEGYALGSALDEQSSSVEIVTYPNELMALRALSIGNIDALVADLGVASYYVAQEHITNLRVLGDFNYVEEQSIGSRNDWPELNAILTAGMASITPAEHQAIANRWVSITNFSEETTNDLLQWLVVVLIVGLVSALGSVIWIYSLKRQVRRRTALLESELTERKKAEAENYRLATAVEQSAEYVLIINKKGIIEYANLAFFRLSTAAAVLGKLFIDIAREQDKRLLLKALSKLKTGEVWRGKIFLAVTEAENVHVAMTITPIQGENETDGYVATGRDISHEEAMDRRLRHGEKLSALGTIAGGIAHDFNNLLVPILGFTDLLRKDVDVKAQAPLDAINSAARRAQDLVKRILVFSRQSEGKKETIDFGFEVREGITFLRSLLPTSVEIRSNLASDQTISGDQTQIQQIVLNLGTNAADAMAGERGLLEIELDTYEVTISDAISIPELKAGSYSRLLVKDNGSGMTQEQQKRMFDPYFTSKPIGKGTGLGLASVHGIVKNHGGAIRVASVPGKGTELELFFPKLPESLAKRRDVKLQQIPTGKGEQVLLVDDDELVLDSVGYMLDRLGYSVTAKSDPLEALDVIKASPDIFEAIVTDFTMPNMTGVQLVKEVHALKPELPVVLMTGKTDLLEEIELTSIGKPFRVMELATTLSRAL
jgi:PAS domain S-box-containing protein